MSKSTKPQYIAYIIQNRSNSKYYLCITKKTSISKGKRCWIKDSRVRKKKIVNPRREVIEERWRRLGKADYYVFFCKPRGYNKKVFEKETQEERMRMVREGLYSEEELIRYYEA